MQLITRKFRIFFLLNTRQYFTKMITRTNVQITCYKRMQQEKSRPTFDLKPPIVFWFTETQICKFLLNAWLAVIRFSKKCNMRKIYLKFRFSPLFTISNLSNGFWKNSQSLHLIHIHTYNEWWYLSLTLVNLDPWNSAMLLTTS